jgi:hypothetical protein
LFLMSSENDSGARIVLSAKYDISTITKKYSCFRFMTPPEFPAGLIKVNIIYYSNRVN